MFEGIGRILREYIFGLSIILTIIGVIVLFIGIFGILWEDMMIYELGLSPEVLNWSLYIIIVGVIVFLFGVWYLYTYIINKRILNEGLQTNKRSEFVKNHAELRKCARRLPSCYLEELRDKEKHFKIK